MLTKISKWLLYIGSCLPVYFLLAIRLLLQEQNEVESVVQLLELNFEQEKYIIVVLLLLIVLSFGVQWKLKKLEPNERIRETGTKNCTGEVAAFFLPFILSFLTISIDWYGWMINVAIFLLFGYVTIQADWIHLYPVFTYLGYRLYQTADGRHILSRLTLEQYNLLLLEDRDGMEVKVLMKNLYVATKNKF